MKSATDLNKSKQAKLLLKLKENTERINMELVEIEKAQNKWETDLDNDKPYFEIPIIIQTKEVKDLLHREGYIIDKISNDIKVNTSRIFTDEEAYKVSVRKKYTGGTGESAVENGNDKIVKEETQCKNEAQIDTYFVADVQNILNAIERRWH